MLNNIIITSKKLESKYILDINKIKKNIGFNHIIVEIIKNINSGFYIIKILNDYDTENLKKNSEYVVNYKLLKKCDDKTLKVLEKYTDKFNEDFVKDLLSEEILNSTSDCSNSSEEENLESGNDIPLDKKTRSRSI